MSENLPSGDSVTLIERLRDFLDDAEGWMTVAGMDGADQPAPSDFKKHAEAVAALAVLELRESERSKIGETASAVSVEEIRARAESTDPLLFDERREFLNRVADTLAAVQSIAPIGGGFIYEPPTRSPGLGSASALEVRTDALEAIVEASYGQFPDKAAYIMFIRDIASNALASATKPEASPSPESKTICAWPFCECDQNIPLTCGLPAPSSLPVSTDEEEGQDG